MSRRFLAAAALLALTAAASHRSLAQPDGPPPGGPPPGERPMGPPMGGQMGGGPPGPNRGFIYAQLARAIDEKASLLLEQGKTDAAIEELKRGFSIDVPKEHPAYEGKAHLISRLAITYANAGKKKEAAETMEKLLADVPPGSVAEASSWVDAGVMYRQLGMADKALEAFDKAIALSEKLAKTLPRGPAGRPMNPGGRPPGNRPPPKGDQ